MVLFRVRVETNPKDSTDRSRLDWDREVDPRVSGQVHTRHVGTEGSFRTGGRVKGRSMEVERGQGPEGQVVGVSTVPDLFPP